MQNIANATFNLIPIVLFTAIFPIILGLLLRLPEFLIQLKEHKHVKFDWIKFTAIAIPTLYILIAYIFSYLGFVAPTHFMMIGGHGLVTISGIVFGYIILDSLKPTPH